MGFRGIANKRKEDVAIENHTKSDVSFLDAQEGIQSKESLLTSLVKIMHGHYQELIR